MSELAVMDRTGDTKIMWDPKNEDEVTVAKNTFADLRKKGYLAYRVSGEKGDKGEQLFEFDKNAEKIILAPPMRGG